jgi:hypothetical protein
MTERDHLEDNFKLYRQEKCGGVEWINLAQDGDKRRAVVNTNEHLGSIKSGEFLDCGPSGFKKVLISTELCLPDDT